MPLHTDNRGFIVTFLCFSPAAFFFVLIPLVLSAIPLYAGDAVEKIQVKNAYPLRTGLWVIEHAPEDDNQLRRFERELSRNPDIKGVILHDGWEEVEKEEGKYDFERFDKAAAVLRKHKVKYKLGVKAGIATPQYVYREGAAVFKTVVTNPHRSAYGSAVMIPVPWDYVYQKHYSRLIKTLGERYSSDPLCVSVSVTGANFMSAEMHLPKRAEDLEQWKSLGDYKAKLFEVYKKYIDEWAKAFPRQEISLHISPVLHMAPSEFVEKVIQYGISRYPGRFAIQNNVLTGRREDAGKEPYDIIIKYKGRVHHGFQSLAAFSGTDGRMGSIEMAALNVVHADGKYWELWTIDGMNPEVTQKISKAWDEARRIGYEAYKARLISGGSYLKAEDDTYYQKVKKMRRNR